MNTLAARYRAEMLGTAVVMLAPVIGWQTAQLFAAGIPPRERRDPVDDHQRSAWDPSTSRNRRTVSLVAKAIGSVARL